MEHSKHHRRGLVTFAVALVAACTILATQPGERYWLLVCVVPFLLLGFTFMDAAASEEQVDHLDNPLIGRTVSVEKAFTAVHTYFEGAVWLNGASWTARSSRLLQPGDEARVLSLDGHTLLLS